MFLLTLFLIWGFLFIGVINAKANEDMVNFEHLFDDYECGFVDGDYQKMKCEKKGFQHVMEEEIGLDYWFAKYSREYGVVEEKLRLIAYCESTLDPMAENYIYAGLFQFSPTTWQSNRRVMGLDTNIDLRLSAEESIRTAAYKIARDGTGAWPACQHR